MNDNMRMPPGGSQVRRLGLVGRAGARAIVTGRACLSPASLFPTSMQLPCPFFTRSAAQHNPPLHHTLLHSRRAVGGGDPSGGAGSAEEQRCQPGWLGGEAGWVCGWTKNGLWGALEPPVSAGKAWQVAGEPCPAASAKSCTCVPEPLPPPPRQLQPARRMTTLTTRWMQRTTSHRLTSGVSATGVWCQ